MAREDFVYFPIYFTSRRILEQLDPVQRSTVLMALMDYAELGTEPADLSPLVRVAFESMRKDVDASAKNFDRRIVTSKENGRKGDRPKNDGENEPCENLKKPKKPKKPNKYNININKIEKEINGNGNTRACAREGAPDGAAPPPPPPTSPEDFWVENGFGQSISNAAKCLAPYRAAGCTDGLILRALEIAADNGAPRWVYARSILDRAVAAGTLTAEAFEATRRPCGGGRNARVDRQTPSGNDLLAAAADRPRRLKRKD